jgi:hypothetical protein
MINLFDLAWAATRNECDPRLGPQFPQRTVDTAHRARVGKPNASPIARSLCNAVSMAAFCLEFNHRQLALLEPAEVVRAYPARAGRRAEAVTGVQCRRMAGSTWVLHALYENRDSVWGWARTTSCTDGAWPRVASRR